MLPIHYNDVIMSVMASQITNLVIVHSTVYSGADQRKHQSSASLAFVWEIHRWPAQRASNAEIISIWWRHHVSACHHCTLSFALLLLHCLVLPYAIKLWAFYTSWISSHISKYIQWDDFVFQSHPMPLTVRFRVSSLHFVSWWRVIKQNQICIFGCWSNVNDARMQRTMYMYYSNAIISAMASQITGVYSVADYNKHQSSSASLAIVSGTHRWSVVSLTKGQ